MDHTQQQWREQDRRAPAGQDLCRPNDAPCAFPRGGRAAAGPARGVEPRRRDGRVCSGGGCEPRGVA
jgi:hypothetical protein